MADGRKSIASRYQAVSGGFNVGSKTVDTDIVEHVILNEGDENILEVSGGSANPKLIGVQQKVDELTNEIEELKQKVGK